MADRPASKNGGHASMRRIGALADGGVVPQKPLTRKEPPPGPRRLQDAQTVDEALDIERETGRREGVKSQQKRPITRYGPEGKPRVDAPKAPSKSLGDLIPSKGIAHDGAGVVVGLVAYALFLAYVKGGWSGVTTWLSAKFLNKTSAAPNPTPQNPTGVGNNDKTGNNAWIKAHLGQWPHPGAGANDFWNAIAAMAAQKAGIPMQGNP